RVERGAVAAAAAGLDLDPQRALLRHLDPPPERPAVDDLVAAALADHRLSAGEELGEMGEEPLRALPAAALLVRHGEEDDVPRERRRAPLEVEEGRQHGDAQALVVDGATPPEPALPDAAGA